MDIAIWGTGKKCKELLNNLRHCNVVAFVESQPQYEEFRGIEVCLPEQLMKMSFDLLVVSVVNSADIEKKLYESYSLILHKCVFLFLENIKNVQYFFNQYRLVNGIIDRKYLLECCGWSLELLRYDYRIMQFREDLNLQEKELLYYAQKKGFMQKLNYSFTEKYLNCTYNIQKAQNGMYYVRYLERDVYFPRSWNRKKIICYWAAIGKSAFMDCNSLMGLSIPDTVKEIGEYAFVRCDSLLSVNIPNGVKEIGIGTFAQCTSLMGVIIPSSVGKIGKAAFRNCNKICHMQLPNGITEIAEATFLDCLSLVSIDIPDSVTKIGKWAFVRCKSLKGVTIPNNVTEIGEYAFACCSSLTSMTIPNSVMEIGEHAFDGCINLRDIRYDGTEAQWNAVKKGDECQQLGVRCLHKS